MFLNISITVAVISLLMLIIVECLICRTHPPDEVRDGMELTTWDERNKWNVRALQYGLTALVTAYLPLSQLALEVFACTPTFRRGISAMNMCNFGTDDMFNDDRGGGGGGGGSGGTCTNGLPTGDYFTTDGAVRCVGHCIVGQLPVGATTTTRNAFSTQTSKARYSSSRSTPKWWDFVQIGSHSYGVPVG